MTVKLLVLNGKEIVIETLGERPLDPKLIYLVSKVCSHPLYSKFYPKLHIILDPNLKLDGVIKFEEIQNGKYIIRINPDTKNDFERVLIHEMVHVFQSSINFHLPRLRAGGQKLNKALKDVQIVLSKKKGPEIKNYYPILRIALYQLMEVPWMEGLANFMDKYHSVYGDTLYPNLNKILTEEWPNVYQLMTQATHIFEQLCILDNSEIKNLAAYVARIKSNIHKFSPYAVLVIFASQEVTSLQTLLEMNPREFIRIYVKASKKIGLQPLIGINCGVFNYKNLLENHLLVEYKKYGE